MKLQVKEIINGECEVFTNVYETADKAFKVLNEMREFSIESGYTIVGNSKNHLLVEKINSMGVKIVKSFLVF
jgi:hypothetical protein